MLIALLILLGFQSTSHAYESDQFTIPPMELADVGEDISIFAYTQIKKSVEQINLDLKELPHTIEQTKAQIESNEALEKPLLMRELKAKLKTSLERYKAIQTEEGIVASIYERLGSPFTWEDQRDGVFGLPLSIIPYPENVKDGKKITYVPKTTENIYALAGFHRIISPTYFVFCSSLKMFGIYVGVDKLGHIFNQGHEYFELYNKKISEGHHSDDALKLVIDWGRSTEDGIFGTIVDGVYSNGDLAANYIGMTFYKNLLDTVVINGNSYAPILVINTDKTISLNPESLVDESSLLKPFITAHLNEALNPSHFEKLQRIMVEKAIIKRCEDVKKFYEIKEKDEIEAITKSLFTYYGQDYGHRSDDLLKIDELCFNAISL
jgi:hypothetical protein